jgi:hypothetical protein
MQEADAIAVTALSGIIVFLYWRLCLNVLLSEQHRTPEMQTTLHATAIKLTPRALENIEKTILATWGGTWLLSAGLGGLHIMVWRRGDITDQSIMLFGIMAWMGGLGYSGWYVLRHFFQTEELVFSSYGMGLTYRFLWVTRTKIYTISAITAFRPCEQAIFQGQLVFMYGRDTIPCCGYLARSYCDKLSEQLSEILTFQRIEHVVFGRASRSVPQSPATATTLWNPDLSSGSVPPLYQLQWLVLHASTCNSRLVELFVTHILNSLGQEYVKKHLKVAIYGPAEQLQPNLYHTLRHIAKQVHLHG